jgi:hypothetical protein
VAQYAHDADRLYVRFRNGSVGYYENVSAALFDEFHGSESHGRFVHGRLKANAKQHPWRKVS